MEKFKIGDRVKLVKVRVARAHAISRYVAVEGSEGVIVGEGFLESSVLVRFDSSCFSYFVPRAALKEAKK